MDFLTLLRDVFVLYDQGVTFLSDEKDIPGCDLIESRTKGEKIKFAGIGGGLYCIKLPSDVEFVLLNRQEMEYFFEEKDVFYVYLKYGSVGDAEAEKYMDLHIPKS